MIHVCRSGCVFETKTGGLKRGPNFDPEMGPRIEGRASCLKREGSSFRHCFGPQFWPQDFWYFAPQFAQQSGPLLVGRLLNVRRFSWQGRSTGCARGCLCDSLKCVLGQAQLSLTQPENLQPWRHLRTQPVSGRDFGTLKQGPCMRAVFKVFRDRMSLRTIFSLRQLEVYS